MKTIRFPLILASILTSHMAFGSGVNRAVENDAKIMVENLYQQMDVARKNYANDAYMKAQQTFCKSFQLQEEQELPNDIQLFYKNSDKKFLISSAYITALSNATNEGSRYNLTYQIISSNAMREEESRKNETSANYVMVIVKKKFELQKPVKTIELKDTLIYDTKKRSIVNVYNIV